MAVSYNINTQAHPSTSATQNIYSPGYPFGYASGNIYHTNRPNPYQATTPGVAPGLCYIAPQVATISANTKSSTESARRNPSRKRKEHPRDVTGLETWRLPGLNENPRRTQQPAERARRLARKRTANTHPGQQPAENTANTPAVGQGRQSSKRGQAKAKLGDNLGFDRRPRAPIKEIGGVLWGLVNDEWSMLM